MIDKKANEQIFKLKKLRTQAINTKKGRSLSPETS
ncbi:hypothetical protein Y788_21065 [Pantoea dispersa 625]|nr:hypothetical protein Y788_21065 [Pantoea dispersa 625]